MRKVVVALGLIGLTLCVPMVSAQQSKNLRIERADESEVIVQDDQLVFYVTGNVVFETETGLIFCDSARWVRGSSVQLNGNVVIDEEAYRLTGDSVFYDLMSGTMLARGQRVSLWSYEDSLYASGTHAFYNERTKFFEMMERPVLYINYPDTTRMIEVVSEHLRYDAETKDAEATGDVKITSDEFSSFSQCARMNTDGDVLDLFEEPSARRGESTITGGLISIYFSQSAIDYIDVVDSARGEFKEPVDTTQGWYDRSVLSGNRMFIYFVDGELSTMVTYGQAYSWYFPSPRGGREIRENTVSGDTIKLYAVEEALNRVEVIGGAVGDYVSRVSRQTDSGLAVGADTINYEGQFIEYKIADSLITLYRSAVVRSGAMSLSAHEVVFDTHEDIIEAYSAELADTVDTRYSMAEKIQPNFIPVVLKDKSEEIYGDYLRYSVETEKGRIIQSKTAYDQGFYYGSKLYREQKDVFYVDEGRYTTCNADEPHFHFYSTNMKLMENNKLIAKPVVFYIERIPVFALPYYIIPLKKGRHSGFLPFTFGQFQRGERYVKNVGYYWAASDYWDLQGAFDYFEQSRTLNFYGRMSFNKRYVLNGSVSGNYSRVTSYNSSVASEYKSTRWTLRGTYNHTISPSFTVRADGEFQSDATYYQDYSFDLDDRINRQTKSTVNFSKRFGSQTSLSGSFSHYENLDLESRTDELPNATLSLPTIYPFGSGSRNEEGQLEQKWYHKFSLRYSPNLRNHSSRSTLKVIDTVSVDTSGAMVDTTSYRTRRQFTRLQHNPKVTLPGGKIGNFVNLVPSFGYSETWFKIWDTDQADSAGINTSTTYRTYSWNASIAANSKLYGTVYPNVFGLVGLRHVLDPSITYTYTPDIQKHPEIRTYAGGGAASNKSSRMGFQLSQTFQAKVSSGETERTLNLLTVGSAFSYDFENDERPLSNLSTRIQTTALPILSNLSGSMTHTFYNPETGEENFWSPYLTDFAIDAQINISGERFFFDDDRQIPRGVDSASHIGDGYAPTAGSRSGGWNFSATYSYIESGRGAGWTKRSFVNFNLSFYLTPTTSVSYSQQYDIVREKTINSRVNIVKSLHCWTGSIYWVPSGSNRGVGFNLHVTAIPEIKFDNNYSDFTEALRR